jgi:uncharacterized protein YbjT (DUF2867 family)
MRVFVAGATGATGQVFVPMASAFDLVVHVRPQSKERTPLGKDPRARVFDLADERALADALRGCDAVVSFVGTMRARFSAGDTYESSDVGSTRALVAGAQAVRVPRFLLLSSLGAGGAGAYLKMKGECERIVRESGLAWTLFRPSALVSPDDVGEGAHGKRTAPPGARAIFRGISRVPGLSGWAEDVGPIPIEVVSRAFVRVLEKPRDGETLQGRDLYAIARETSN